MNDIVINGFMDEIGKLAAGGRPSAGLSAKKKSRIVSEARAGKDIGKKGKGFSAVAAKAAKQYGSAAAGRRVAAASMWRSIKRGA